MNARFYAPAAEKSGETIELPDDEAQHLARVLRLKAGAAIQAFNGRGREFDAVVDRVGKGGVSIVVGKARTDVAREPRVAVTLALAVLKPENMDDAIRDAVMMGVVAIQPVVAARSETTLAAMQRGKRIDRWGRIAVSSAKQCGRATVPAILEPWEFEVLPAALSRFALPGPGLMFVEPSAAAEATADITEIAELDPVPPHETTVITGPEGGWTPQEVEQASAACRLVTLGGLTLRAAAMPTVALAALRTIWRDM
jgi:16S rRNA (uracil1498-N3)-methyltransferase